MAEQRITNKPTVSQLLDEDYLFINHDGALRQVRKDAADLASAAGLAAEATARQQFMADETQARQAFETAETAARQAFQTAETAAREQFEQTLIEANEEFADAVTDQIENKANVDGYYEDLTAGSAEQLLSTVQVEDQVPYLFRKSGDGKSIGNREIDTLVGGSVVWNQLIPVRVTQASQTVSGVTITNNQDGSFTVTGTATADISKALITNSLNIIANHIYYMPQPKGASASGYFLRTGETTFWNYKEIGKGAANDANNNIRLIVLNGTTINVTFYLQWFDLTAMFDTAVADRLYQMEQANAGSGVAWFRERFPKEYYAYNQGEIMSVKTSAHEMVGFNQWDGVSHSKSYWADSGVIATLNGNACTDKIPVIPLKDYYFSYNDVAITVKFFDSNMSLLLKKNIYSQDIRTMTAPVGSAYCCVNFTGENAPTEFCINFSSDRNGEYEPYQKRTYQLDPIELMGTWKVDANGEIYTDGDRYPSSGKVDSRYSIVDLGTLDWIYESSVPYFRATVTGIKRTATWNTVVNSIVQAKYTPTYGNNLAIASSADKAIAVSPSADTLIIRDTAYTDAAAFKTAMSGVYLVYEKATPTTETADPFTSPQIVDPYGTERYVDTREVAVPVGHETEYPADLRNKLQNLPELASGDGLYIIRQTSGKLYLDTSPIPSAPTTDGTYTLKVTVSNGTPAYAWEVEA